MNNVAGLVLSGGASKRMGRDKGQINYHGTDQRSHCAQMLSQFCSEVYISCNEEQVTMVKSQWPTILDTEKHGGPVVGLVSAFKKLQRPLLVMPVDMPFVESRHLARLMDERGANCDITLFKNEEGFYEPLLALWETSALEKLELALEQNQRNLQRIIKTMDTKLIYSENFDFLQNINLNKDYETYIPHR